MRAMLLGAGIAVVAGAAFAMRAGPARDGWSEIAWPFPRDAWPAGRAFRCDDAGCGGPMETYVRPKLGFCNCATGVSGDAEVDGVSDLDMVGTDFVPLAAGTAVAVGGLHGRVRSYDLTMPDGRMQPAAGFALSATCDLVAVASVGPAAATDAGRAGVLQLLGGAPLATWLRSRLGGST